MGLVHRVGWDPALCERSPWFWPLRAAAARFAQHADWPTLAELTAAYAKHTRGLDVAQLKFCANVKKSDKRAAGRVVINALYDARITLAREVPTRERDWHDVLNMLCFATFPHSKLALHARQYTVLTERLDEHTTRLPNRRTPEQDTLTLLDEGGVIVAVSGEAALQLQAADPQARETLAGQLHEQRAARVIPFGHALYEHLVEGLRCPGGCTQIIAVSELWADTPALLHELDRELAKRLKSRDLLCSPAECGQIRLAAFSL
jgi:hypothetical protein